MFNNLIRKNYDVLLDGPSIKLPIIFNQNVKNALHCVLQEMLIVSSGTTKRDYPEAVKKGRIFFSEAMYVIEEGLVDSLLNIKNSSFEKECGIRLAIISKIMTGELSKSSQIFFFNTIRHWFQKPVGDNQMFQIFVMMFEDNKYLDDRMARSIINEKS